MKISEVINKLQEIKEYKGDLYVDVKGYKVFDVNFNVFTNTASIEL